MKNIRAVILALCAGALSCMAAQAQFGNISYGSNVNPSDSGFDNSAFGFSVLFSNAGGSYNTGIGVAALSSNTTGSYNTATGMDALTSNTTGYSNTATGFGALLNNSIGLDNVATGYQAMYSNTTGYENTTAGYWTLYDNTSGFSNTAIGGSALFSNTTGNSNAAVGGAALQSNTTGSSNAAFGYGALAFNTTGTLNTAVGLSALLYNTTGNYNIGIGQGAGYQVTTGSYNIDIDNYGTSSDNGVIRIGTSGTQTTFYAAGIDGVGVSGGVPVFINGNGQLGTVNSSIRFKEDVHDMGDSSSAIFRLRPVTYRYKQAYADGSKPIDYGLIAEEVAKVYPDMVVRGTDGQIQTVQYQKLTPMLLNELQKQHQIIAQQGEAIRELKEQQAETVHMLEKRLAALESTQTSSDPVVRQAAE